jgi:putative transcriptional regulator
VPNSQGGYLDGSFLVATPALVGSCFEKSVVYVCTHSSDGAMGLVINQPLAHLECRDVLKQLEIRPIADTSHVPVHFGGPMETGRGFVIHSDEYAVENTVPMENGLALTSNIDVMQDLAIGRGPEKALLTMGFAGWAAGQLEHEIEENVWISVPASAELVFSTDNESKWLRAGSMVGIDLYKLSLTAGHA